MEKQKNYRGKRIDTGAWIFGYYLTKKLCDGQNRHHYIKSDGNDGIEVDPETVGQFTGIEDKNGKEIYNGDICNVDTKFVGKRHIVVWNQTKCCFMWKLLEDIDNAAGTRLLGNERYIDQYGWGNPAEVIGNIHENPELLL